MQTDREERPFEELSIDEKIVHVWDLQKRIEQEIADLTLTDEQIAEVERRWNEHKMSPGPTFSWEEVREQLLRRVR